MAICSPAALDALSFPAIGVLFGGVNLVHVMPLLNRRKIAPVRELWFLPMNCADDRTAASDSTDVRKMKTTPPGGY